MRHFLSLMIKEFNVRCWFGFVSSGIISVQVFVKIFQIVDVAIPKLCAAGYFKILFFLSIYVYSFFKCLRSY
jgi:hypothetical protein